MLAMDYKGPYRVRAVQKPEPEIEHPDDCIVRVTRSCICGSDLHLYHGFVPDTRVGSTFGHEFIGVVVEIGTNVQKLKVGDHVIVPFNISCGKCAFCKQELYGNCHESNPEATAVGGIFGYSHTAGGFQGGQAEYVRVPYADVGPTVIPPEMDPEDAVLLTDVVPTAYQAFEMGGIVSGDTVVVFGAGPIGIMAAKCAWLFGAGRVIIIDNVDYRLEFARNYAPCEAYNFNEMKDVVAAIISLEDNKYFNAGRGSAITAAGNVEMCSSIMDGKNKKTGAVAIVNNVRNPISFARELLKDDSLMYLGGQEATETAKDLGITLEPDAYFITEHQWDAFEKARKKKVKYGKAMAKYLERQHGTVGAVALDIDGNLAAGTSTGGTEYCQPGRIGDSSMIGVGTYADNKTAAVSCTGDGEYLITEVLAHSIAATIEHTGCTIQEAIDSVILEKNEDTQGDLGAIGIDAHGNIGIAFNSVRMHRAWRTREDFGVQIYK